MVDKAITSQSKLSSDNMQHVPHHQSQADSRAATFDQVIPAPAQPVYHPDPREEIHPLEQQLRRLAQKYGIDFDEGADAAAVLQEVERRAGKSLRKRSSGRTISFASLRDAFASVFNKTNAELKRPSRPDASVTQQSGSPTPDTQQSIPPESRSLTEGVRYDVGRYQLWAVLIGIDAYTQDPLRGCVSDALSIKHFLTDDLGVPENHIKCLLGSKDPNPADPKSTPSRANIVDTLYSLANNPKIGRDDNIIIYYAGHGTSYYCTKHYPESHCDYSCPIEALCPIDRDTQDADGNWIPDISDRELNILFALICHAKGQNITFIADCCHSGGMSRGQQRGIRSTTLTYNASLESMLHAADEMWKDSPGYRSVLSKDWQPDMDSHVILAACQSYQKAEEDEFGGVFSKELVGVLRSTKCREETTYDGLIRLLNLPSGKHYQKPHVEGIRMFKPILNRTPPQFWAVLIGIDAYTQCPLRGCVSDALLIKRFLTDDIGVPENRIQCLLGPSNPNSADLKSISPTRANIVDTLCNLASNTEIGRGDNIIIYYTGHSSRYSTVEPRGNDFSIEALCPIDCGTRDADGNLILDISDRELNVLFGLICRAKGENITFIVDASYSGRMSSGQLPVSTIETSTKVESMLHAADARWKDFPGYRSVLSKDWQPDMDSHVILAACLSMEVNEGGIFTGALLRALRSTDWKEEMTYVDLINLMSGLPWSLKRNMHTPHVSGKRMNEPFGIKPILRL